MTKSPKHQNHSFVVAALIAILISFCLQGIKGEIEHNLENIVSTHLNPPASPTANQKGGGGGGELITQQSFNKSLTSRNLDKIAAAASENGHNPLAIVPYSPIHQLVSGKPPHQENNSAPPSPSASPPANKKGGGGGELKTQQSFKKSLSSRNLDKVGAAQAVSNQNGAIENPLDNVSAPLMSPPASPTNHSPRGGGGALTPRRSFKKTRSSKKRLENAAAAALANGNHATESIVPTSHPQSPKNNEGSLQSATGSATATHDHVKSPKGSGNHHVESPQPVVAASTNALKLPSSTDHGHVNHGPQHGHHVAHYPPAFPAHSAHKLKEIKADLMKASAVPLPADEDDGENWHKEGNLANGGEVSQIHLPIENANESGKGSVHKFDRSNLKVEIPAPPNAADLFPLHGQTHLASPIVGANGHGHNEGILSKVPVHSPHSYGSEYFDSKKAVEETQEDNSPFSQVQQDIEIVKPAGNEHIIADDDIVMADSSLKGADSGKVFGKDEANSRDEWPEASAIDPEYEGEEAINPIVPNKHSKNIHTNNDGIANPEEDNPSFSGEPLHSQTSKLEKDEEMKQEDVERDELRADDNAMKANKDKGLNSSASESALPLNDELPAGEASTGIHQKTNVQLGEGKDGHGHKEGGQKGENDGNTDGDEGVAHPPSKWGCNKFPQEKKVERERCQLWEKIDNELHDSEIHEKNIKYYASKDCTKIVGTRIVKNLMVQAKKIVGDWNGNEHEIANADIKIPEATYFAQDKCTKIEKWVNLAKDAKEHLEEVTTISAEEMKEFGLGDQAFSVDLDINNLPLAYNVDNDAEGVITLAKIQKTFNAINNVQDAPDVLTEMSKAVLEEEWKEVARVMKKYQETIVNNWTHPHLSKVTFAYTLNGKKLSAYELLALAKKMEKNIKEGKSVLIMPPKSEPFKAEREEEHTKVADKSADQEAIQIQHTE